MSLAVLREGARGADVKNVQHALDYHMPNVVPPLVQDGIFGPKTKARTIAFQKANDLTVDGIVGPETRKALFAFVTITHHILPSRRPVGASIRQAQPVNFQFTPPPGPLPPMPRLQLTFPEPFRLPSQVKQFTLELDPNLLAFLKTRPFEIGAGTKMVFRSDKPGAGVAFLDVQATIWSKPLGKKVEVGLATGVGFEHRINDGKFETSVVVLAKVEVKDILKLGPVDIANLQLEGGLSGTPGSKEPADMVGTVKLGPKIETRNGRFSFGAGGYLDYSFNGIDHEIVGGVHVEGAFRF